MATSDTSSSDGREQASAVTGRIRPGAGIAIALIAVGVVASGAMFFWDDWYVNFDGGIYLGLATNLRRGAGFVFPDGTFATFRGPMYPAAVAGAWLFLADTARTAIWVSRLILVTNAIVLALIVWKLSNRAFVALVGGVLAAIQPLALMSGGLLFVPDGMMAFFVLAAVLVYVWHPPTIVTAPRLGIVGILIGLAFLTKQTGALGGLIVAGLLVSAPSGGIRRLVKAIPPLGFGFMAPVAAWSIYALAQTDRLPTGVPGPRGMIGGVLALVMPAVLLAVWAAATRGLSEDEGDIRLPRWAVVTAAFLISLSGLMTLGAAPIVPVGELWTALPTDLVDRIYRDTPWGLLLIPLIIALAWGAVHLSHPGALTTALVTGVGLAGIVYAVSAGAGFRNGVLVVYGLAGLLSLASGDLWSAPQFRTLWRSVAVIGIVSAVAGSSAASAVLNDRMPEKAITAENPAVTNAAAWLGGLEPDAVIAGTPIYLSTLWRLIPSHPTLDLVPIHTIGRREWESGQRVFPHRVAWAGTVADPTPLVDPIGVSESRVQLAAFMEPTWSAYVERVRPEYVVVTGNARFSRSAFDGGLLAPYLEASPSANAVYRSDESMLPQWVMVYELSYPFISATVPTLVRGPSDPSLEAIAPDQIVLTVGGYSDMIVELLHRPVR